MDPVEGLYELPLTAPLQEQLDRLSLTAHLRKLDPSTAPLYLARHLHDRVLDQLRGADLEDQLGLLNRLLAVVEVDPIAESGSLLEALTAAQRHLGEDTPKPPERPSVPLSSCELLVNGAHDLNVVGEVRKELASADRVDLLLSFLKFSGVRLLLDNLKTFLQRRPGGLRILTTVYTGATERRALDELKEIGATIKVSYDTQRTRLHAKAWLFHRESGFSTAVVGSSNLSSAALVDGLEWNVRLSQIETPGVLAKFTTTFAQYWDDPEFCDYDPHTFQQARDHQTRARHASLVSAIEVRPRPHQVEILQSLAAERARGHTRNLVVAATGTGKTVVAALDYRRLRAQGFDSLLFVAHRAEILDQAQSVFQLVLQDGAFGERLGDGQAPLQGHHVFANVQSLKARRLDALDPGAYDVVIVDEFHHAAAPTYQRLLEHLRPKILLGLTATPERADGQSVLPWFDGRVASELRLWTAVDQGLLCPFHYFGVYDDTDLSTVPWRQGRYDPQALERLYTAEDMWAQRVLQAVQRHVRDPHAMRALGFCVSVKHAEFMAAKFEAAGISAAAVSHQAGRSTRNAAIADLNGGRLQALFSVDLFNEGVDVPSVDTVLFLRPSDSPTVFLQQLGRGLRVHEKKECLTVLDFVGHCHKRYRFERKLRALLGGTRQGIATAIERDAPPLPAGCALTLDRQARQIVLSNLRTAVRQRFPNQLEDLRGLGRDVSLSVFLEEAGLDLEDVYAGSRGAWTHLRRDADLPTPTPGPREDELLERLRRLLHVNDTTRLQRWQAWLRADALPGEDDPLTCRLKWQLMVALGFTKHRAADVDDALSDLWSHPAVRAELREALAVLDDRRREDPPVIRPETPLAVHGVYTRDEVFAGLGAVSKTGRILAPQQGVYVHKASNITVLLVTLEKSERDYTPSTLYRDYPISPTLFHWESQHMTKADSKRGRRLIDSEGDVWLFVRLRKDDGRGGTAPYRFLGPVSYVSHQGERPIQFVWKLDTPMPPGFYEASKVAAG